MISANELKATNFSAEQSGYSREEVDFAIDQAAKTIDAYANQSNELYHKLEVLASKIEEYREEEDSIKSALITAQKMADKMRKESSEAAAQLISTSEEQAKATVENANAEADKIITSAREFASAHIEEKTSQANQIVSDAQAKANEAISSAKIVAEDILSQARAISDDLIAKSKEEKEAYELLVAALKGDAKQFVENLKTLYTEQLDALNNAKLDTESEQVTAEVESVDSIQQDVDSLVSEIDEMESAIPEVIELDIPEPAVEEAPVEETPVEEIVDEVIDEPVEEELADDVIPFEIEEISIDEEQEDEPEELEPIIDDEPIDPMDAVSAFSKNEFTPIDTSEPYIPVISEEPDMVEQSLFDTESEQLPFESYFNVKTEDAHNDPSQKISLVPPEDDDDDDEPKFKSFFKRK